MPNITTVLFDLGATLVYFDSEWDMVMHQAAQQLHRKLLDLGYDLPDRFPLDYHAATRDYYRTRDEELVETPSPVTLRKVLGDYGYGALSNAHVDAALAAFFAVTHAHWHGEQDAVPTLRALRESGLRIGLVSNAAYDADIQGLIDEAGLRSYLDFIISSAACGVRKPHPRIFETALDALDARAAESVMVGDRLEADILGANRLGMGSVWITRRVNLSAAAELREQIEPARTISALDQLPALIAAWDHGR